MLLWPALGERPNEGREMSYEAFDPLKRELTPAMIELLQDLADGETVKAWAFRKKRHPQTVKNVLSLIRDALGASTTVQAAVMAKRRKLIE